MWTSRKPKTEPAPRKLRILNKVKLVHIPTGDTLEFTDENGMGLSTRAIEKHFVDIRQYRDYHHTSDHRIAMLYGYSVVSMDWHVIEVSENDYRHKFID